MAASAYSKVTSRQQGFTLLEIMVAFVITGLVVGALLQVFGTAMRNIALSAEYSQAVQIAESRLETIGSFIEVKPGRVEGREGDTAYYWQVNMEPIDLIEQLDDFSLSIQPYQVMVQVNWESDGKQRQYVLSSLRFGAEP